MEKPIIRVLLIEDDQAPPAAVQETLSRDLTAVFHPTHVQRLGDALVQLRERRFDIALLSLGLEDSTGLAIYEQVRQVAPDLPVIVLAATWDEQLAMQAMRAGAQDYLIKGPAGLESLSRAIRCAIERQSNQAALKASEQRFRAVVENSADAIALLDADGTILYESPSAERVLGYQATAAVGHNILEFLRTGERAAGAGLLVQVLRQPRNPVTAEIEYRRQDDSWRWMEVTANNLLDEPGVQAIVVNYHDISDRREAQRSLSRFELLSARSRDILLYVRADDGRILEANSAAVAAYGYSREELLALTIRDLRAPETLDTVAGQLDQANREGLAFETIHRRKDGSTFPVEVSSSGATRGGEHVALSIIRDITERKRAQEALRQSEELLQAAIRVANIGIFDHDQRTDSLYVSPRQREIYGLNVDEPGLLQMIPQLTHPDDRDRVDAAVGRAHDPAGDGLWDVEHRIVRRDGSIGWLAARSQTFFEGAGEARRPVRTVGAVLDITERKQAEEALRLTQFCVDHASVGIMRTGKAAEILSVNDQMCRLLGYSAEELVHLHVYDVDPNFPPERWKAHRKRLASEGADTFETLHRRKDGATLPVQVTNSYIEFGGEEYSISFIQDITERKRVEEALRESEARLDGIIASAMDAVITLDEAQHVVVFNTAAEQVFGCRAEEVFGQTLDRFIPPELVDAHRGHLSQFARTGTTNRAMGRLRTLRARRADGQEFPMEASISQTVVQGKKLLTVILRDITERQRAEEALRDSEEKFRGFIEQSLAGFTLLDEQGAVIEWNRAREQMTGWTRDQVVGRPYWDVQQDLLPPDERSPERYARNKQSMLDALRTGRAPFFERNMNGHVMQPDGTRRFVQQAIFPIPTDRGFRIGSVTRDVTEHLQRERELEAVAALSTALRVASTPDTMLPIILDQLLDLMNATGTALDHYDPVSGEVVIEAARGAWAPMRGRHPSPGRGHVQQVIATGQPYVRNDVSTEAQFFPARLLAGIGAAACVPLIAQGQAFGGLWVGRPAPFGTEEIRLLTSIADIAASAIHRASLHDQTQRRLHQLTALRAVDQAISSSMELPITLNLVVDQVMTQLQTDTADVLLLNSEGNALEYAAGRGFRNYAAGHPNLPLGQGYASQVVLDQRLIGQPDLMAEAPAPHEAMLPTGEGFQAYYGVPLIAKAQVMGVLEVFQRAPLHPDSDWLEFLQALAGQAAIAIDNARLFGSLQRSNAELTQAYDATIEGWSRALDLRDKETEGHSQRVTALTLELAVSLGMPAEQLVHVRRGSLLHDIGKMGVPDSILLKPGPLSSDEWVIMRLHPTFAYDMLAPIAYLGAALDIPFCHHEKWDGTGYPRGLAGEQVPLAARVFAVVDVWDALRSNRPYRPAWPKDKVLEYLQSQAGTHFDPQVVKAALESSLLAG